MLCRSLQIPPIAAFQSVSSLALEVLGLSMGKREVPVNEFSLRDINHWRTGIMGHTAARSPFSGQCSTGAQAAWIPIPRAVTHSWAQVRWPASPPASLPHSLMSLDSNLCLKGLLCANPLGETQKGNSKLSQNCYFFFPNRITAACYNHSNRELSIPEFPGMFVMVF